MRIAYHLDRLQRLDKALEYIVPELFPTQLPSFEKHRYLQLIAIVNKSLGFLSARIQIMRSHEWTQTNLLYPDVFLTLFTFPLLFCLLILKFFKINKLGYRRLSIT